MKFRKKVSIHCDSGVLWSRHRCAAPCHHYRRLDRRLARLPDLAPVRSQKLAQRNHTPGTEARDRRIERHVQGLMPGLKKQLLVPFSRPDQDVHCVEKT